MSLGSGPVRAIERLGHTFSDAALAELALTHSSAGSVTANGRRDNERLEFLGDAVLDLIVAEELYEDAERHSEGELTEMKAQVVSRRALAEAARRLALGELARLGPGLRQRALSRSVLANLYEAVVGAIYRDAGLDAAREFILRSLGEDIDGARERRGEAVPKQAFQEHCQRRWGSPPTYELVDSRGEDHARAFLVRAVADGRRFPTAWGRTVKEAEHWAAYEALLVLDENDDETGARSGSDERTNR